MSEPVISMLMVAMWGSNALAFVAVTAWNIFGSPPDQVKWLVFGTFYGLTLHVVDGLARKIVYRRTGKVML